MVDSFVVSVVRKCVVGDVSCLEDQGVSSNHLADDWLAPASACSRTEVRRACIRNVQGGCCKNVLTYSCCDKSCELCKLSCCVTQLMARRLEDVLSGKVHGMYGVSEAEVRAFEVYANVSLSARVMGRRALAGETCETL